MQPMPWLPRKAMSIIRIDTMAAEATSLRLAMEILAFKEEIQTTINTAVPNAGKKKLPAFKLTKTLDMITSMAIGIPYTIALVNKRFEMYSASDLSGSAGGCIACST